MRKMLFPAVLAALVAAAACDRATPTDVTPRDPSAAPHFDGTQSDTTKKCGMIGSGTCPS